MAAHTQTDRPMSVKTPLGDDVMLLGGFTGQEAISQLFHYHLDLFVEHTKKGDKPVPKQIAIEELLGKSITIEMALPDDKKRYFNGICNRISQGGMDETFMSYRVELVPKFWLLTRTQRCRIFQPPESTVPQILKKVLQGIDIEDKIQGTFHPRDYCVQYRETDFAFASRIMEEEGIFYYFKHEDGKHVMVLANTPAGHADILGKPEVIFDAVGGGNRQDDRVYEWSKVQELRSGKVTLWDYTFEKPDSHLEASAEIQANAEAGAVTHKLKVGQNGTMEIYDYPGAYAQRFDGIDKGGGEKPADVQKIFQDNARTTGIRMQQEAVGSLTIHGAGNVRGFVAGHKFTLKEHIHANGEYVLTGVQHSARQAGLLSSQSEGYTYSSTFTCIPVAVPFRPQRVTPKALVQGTQTAVVVGPPGEEIFCDKYSRVKVQFHWDREGKKDAGSSCWIRVATIWAGTGYGIINVPRIGQEVVVDFLEGDPDQPIIIGSVYNAAVMPAFGLPDKKMVMGFKSNSTPGGGGYNELTMDDTKGTEKITIHGQFDMNTTVEHDQTTTVHNNRTDVIDVDDSETVGGNQIQHVVKDQTVNIDANRTETVGKNETVTVHGNRTETVDKNETVTVTQNRTHTVTKNETLTVALMRTHSVGINEMINVGAAQQVTVGGTRALTVAKDHTIAVGGAQTMTIAKDLNETVSKNHIEKIAQNFSVTVGKDEAHDIKKKLSLTVGEEIVIKTGKSSITMKKDGTIQIEGKDITLKASGKINGKASKDITLKGQKIAEN